MNIIENLKWRYATKKFDANKTLSKKQLQILKEAFNLTAVSYGLQTLKLVVIKDKEKREALVELSYNQRQVVDASHLLILCVQTEIDTGDVEEHFETIKSIRQTPDEILEPFKNQLKSTIEGMPMSKKENWSTHQAYIALGNLMTVCAMEKIDSCPMEGFNSEAYDKALDLKAHGLKPVLLLPVGYRAEDDMFADFKKVRKSIEKTVIEL
ncbi:NAD(P)H-dependent oxidoreductase [Winogradskyella immobilis]|uniref:NAD(P)H-dependent oxidoreductase n=1 Tax=Winogradskyella immobilis TaxID=2816852 RepID=A0ABS8ELZ1_9FLAO|nr:NAD(P)H-dependent oxidoreductase [Winogradskyella immobilis]MCC1484238.1 NAD(P)H-dependent oxidoreductase [Winogradskyella immobilis]MCG0016330.1 NAD(P)H-dependent oxidoreductase [Winogradskyella immobilis]